MKIIIAIIVLYSIVELGFGQVENKESIRAKQKAQGVKVTKFLPPCPKGAVVVSTLKENDIEDVKINGVACSLNKENTKLVKGCEPVMNIRGKGNAIYGLIGTYSCQGLASSPEGER